MNTLSGFADNEFGAYMRPLLYAREPEEEADYDDLPETQEERPARGSTVRRSVPPKQKKPSSRRPFLLLLLVILIAGAAYVVMTPGAMPPFLAELLGFGSPGAPVVPPAGGTAKVPSPTTQPAHPPTEAPPPITPAPAPPSLDPAVPGPAASAPTAPAPSASAPAPTASATPASAIPVPAFGEGQMVFVALDPTLPVGMMVLSGDSTGSKPGPSVRPGAQVTVLDAEYMPNGWIYSIRTPDGTVGWISEKRLKVGR